jgi:hypothetical protein
VKWKNVTNIYVKQITQGNNSPNLVTLLSAIVSAEWRDKKIQQI